ncbi:S1 family peptidase [Streptomyces sp. ST2-7A]|uniref:S1 family peptidase n=1 Tax=Streptomyces sp. ST2-7A TaxID=2907214 RepID=UPI001F1F3E11|nr:S1 family peptidase [Streptomyces sp. ST2-7A]MCE7081737.1 S1 family peptidase [Streptomyces sp. ST2-7A]
MRIKRALVGLGVLLAATLAAAPGVQADPKPQDKSRTVGSIRSLDKFVIKGSGATPEIKGAARRDLETLARDTGKSLKALERRHQGQEIFDHLASELAAEEGLGYVQAGYVEEGDPAADGAEVWMRFTEKPPQRVLNRLRELPHTVRVQYGAPLEWEDLEKVQEALFGATADFPGTAEVVSEIDPETDGITVFYSVAPGSRVDQEALVSAAMTAGSEASPTGNVPVQVRFSEDPTVTSDTEATVKGGHLLDPVDGSGRSCTSGFTIRVNGVVGVSTAMHCPNSMRYNGVTGVIAYMNAAQRTSSGAHIDLQWHRTLSGHSTRPVFRADYGDERTVSRAKNAVVGSSVCHFGLGTKGKRCSSVRSLGVCYQPDDLRFCGLASTENYVSTGGDSGGPWFFDYEAKGIHSGVYTTGGKQRSLYTPQTRIAENLGGSVLVG